MFSKLCIFLKLLLPGFHTNTKLISHICSELSNFQMTDLAPLFKSTLTFLSITFEGADVTLTTRSSQVFLNFVPPSHVGVGRVTGGCVWELQGSSLSPTWALATPAHQPRLLRAKRSCKQGDNSHHLPASARYRTSPKKFFLNFPEDMVRTPPWLIFRPKKLEK